MIVGKANPVAIMRGRTAFMCATSPTGVQRKGMWLILGRMTRRVLWNASTWVCGVIPTQARDINQKRRWREQKLGSMLMIGIDEASTGTRYRKSSNQEREERDRTRMQSRHGVRRQKIHEHELMSIQKRDKEYARKLPSYDESEISHDEKSTWVPARSDSDG